MHRLSENYKAIQLISPESVTATKTGTGVDVEKYVGDVAVIVSSGALAGTTEINTFTVESSAIGDFTDAVVELTFGALTGSTGDNKMGCGGFTLRPNTKKIRAICTKDSTGAAVISAVAMVKSEQGGATLNSLTPA